MSKFKIPNKDSSLNPYQQRDVLTGRNLMTVQPTDPFLGASQSPLEDFSTLEVDPGQSLYGNSGFAAQVINERKAYNQGALELLGKGAYNVVKTIGIEVGKTPGYIAGIGSAIANETLGDGKNSMQMIVDNAWVNAFEQLDEKAKEFMPVHISKQVQEGGLLDKLGSGAWWATTGAEGLGFMLSMYAPGAAAKALKIGSGIASVGEGLANISTRLGKTATGESWVARLGLMEAAGESGFKYTTDFARNANGYASAAINTTLEASAEAANTFDNMKTKYLQQGLSEDDANSKAGDAAAAVFKGNLALLMVSNVLDEAWIWKTIGTAGEKEAAQSILSKIFKNGEIDMKALADVPKQFTKAAFLKKTGQNFAGGITKEGFYEEGTQTLLQQNIEAEKDKGSVLGNLSNVVSSYFDSFADNDELHESIFLGGLLGGGASVIGTVQENRALKSALLGSKARTKDNSFWTKYGILPETKDQKGLRNILVEDHIKQFRSYKDLIEDTPDGPQLNEQKLIDAQIENADELRTNILYDLSVAQGNKLAQEILNQSLAANYVQSFLGQEGSKELFQDHVDKQVVPAWQKRFEDTFNRPATSKEVADYKRNFTQSGERVIDAYTQAEQTNYPERYYEEKSKEYQDFKREYFHKKFATLVNLDSVKTRREQILLEATQKGIYLEDFSRLSGKQKIKAKELKSELNEIEELEPQLEEHYTKFFSKTGVKELFDQFKNRKESFEKAKLEELEEREKLGKEVDDLPAANEAALSDFLGDSETIVRDKNGKTHIVSKDPATNDPTLDGVPAKTIKGKVEDLGLISDDVSQEQYENFKQTGEVSNRTLKRIAEKLVNKEPLSEKEKEIAQTKQSELEQYFNKEVIKVKEKLTELINNQTEEDTSDSVDQLIDQYNKRKSTTFFNSTGRNLQDELVEIKPGVWIEKMIDLPSQQLWFKVLDEEVSKNPKAYTVQVVRTDDKSNPDLHKQILRNYSDPTYIEDGDLSVILYKDGKPVIKDGNYVFTGLYRPDTLYRIDKSGNPKFLIAERVIIDNFLSGLNLHIEDLSNLSKKQKDSLNLAGVKDTSVKGITLAAFLFAKNEYVNWYESLQANPSQLQIDGITKGHNVKMFKDKFGKEPMWGNPLQGIPGLSLDINNDPKPSDLKGGRLELSTTGYIKVGTEEFKISSGDIVLVDSNDNLHPLRARNITEDEVKTVLYLLSLRAETGRPTESFNITSPQPARFGNIQFKNIPIFYNEEPKKSRANLIESLISFGSKDGGKGEIYFNKETINSTPTLVWTDFEGITHNIDLRVLEAVIKENDFENINIQPLMNFLKQKRFNVNEHLLGKTQTSGNSIFSKPQLVYTRNESGKLYPELKWDQSRSYYDHLLNDVLTTTTQTVAGYPNRVQRNVWFNKQAIQQEDYNSLDQNGFPVNLQATLTKNGENAFLFALSDKTTNKKAAVFELEVVEINGKKYLNIGMVSLREEFRGKGIGTNMYRFILNNLPEGIEGIVSPKDSRINKEQVPKIHNRLAKEFTKTELENGDFIFSKKQSKPSSRKRLTKSLDDFKDMDKILTTSDLLKAKIKSGEITQDCK